MALLCIAAMAMHAINIEWGLPPNEDDREFRQIHPDERVTYEQAWRLYIDPGPVTFVWGGSAYFRLGMWVKEVATYFSDPDFTVRLQVVLLRCLNVAAVGGYVVLAFLCGRELFDNRTALLACLWMAIIPGNVVTALPARPESIFTFLCALSLYAGLRATRSSSSLQWLAIGSFVMGVAVATKMTGVCLIASLVAVVLQFRPTVGQFVGMLGLITIAGVFGYFVASFESFFFWEQWQAGIVLTRHLHSARQWPDIGHSVRSYLGPNAGFAWSVPGVVLLWLGAFLAVRRWRVVIILAFLLAGHLLLFLQRDVTLRSQVHLSIAVALIVAHAMVTVVDNCARRPWLRRIAVFAEVVLVLFVMQESLGHVAYLRWGKDARVQASEWIESNIPPDRLIGITPYYYGDWSAVPPLDERRRRVAVLPTSRAYDASGYKDRALDYVVLCNLSIENIDNSAEAMEFVRFVQAEHVYRRVQTFRSSFDTVRIAEWLGGKLPYDWEYTRPTLYLYERPGRTE
jgi:hypothetical protein